MTRAAEVAEVDGGKFLEKRLSMFSEEGKNKINKQISQNGDCSLGLVKFRDVRDGRILFYFTEENILMNETEYPYCYNTSGFNLKKANKIVYGGLLN